MKSSKLITEEFMIKGMVCSRCISVLHTEMTIIEAEIVEIQLGKIVIRYDIDKIDKFIIEQIFQKHDFEIIRDKEKVIAERTKRSVLDYLLHTEQEENLSNYLVKKLNINYDHLSKSFSKTFGQTIERYSILLMIERTKELVENGELSFSEIAYSMGYQNPSALSRQFKRETGMTMKEYKNLSSSKRIPIDKI